MSKENYYLDNAATTWPKPEVVYTAMDQFFRSYGVNPGRSGYDLAVSAEKVIAETRKLLSEFFNCCGDSNRLCFTWNATDSLNMALFGVLGDGDHVVTTRLEHNAVIRPLNHLQRDHGVNVTWVGRDAQGFVDPADIQKAITPKTRAIVINHASNVLGAVQDLAAIGKIAREAGAVFIVDTCQTAGVLPIDADACNVDILTFTGHKGLFGPMGVGGLFVRDGVEVRACRYGGTGVDSISPFQPDKYPFHLESGTGPTPGIAGLNAAQKWFAELGRKTANDPDLSHHAACKVAQEHIHHVEMAKLKRLDDAFRALPGVTIYGPQGHFDDGKRVATMSLNVEGMPADQVGAILAGDYHICVRTGLHCAPLVHEDEKTVEMKGTVRFAPGYFTDDEDIDQGIKALTELTA